MDSRFVGRILAARNGAAPTLSRPATATHGDATASLPEPAAANLHALAPEPSEETPQPLEEGVLMFDVPPPRPLEEVLARAAAEEASPAKPPKKRKNVKSMESSVPNDHQAQTNGTNGRAALVTLVDLETGSEASPSMPEKALGWLEFLVGNVNVAMVPLLLDYYRRLGWIPSEAYGRMCELASGITRETQAATWRTVRAEPAKLAALHRESYRRLRDLFGERVADAF